MGSWSNCGRRERTKMLPACHDRKYWHIRQGTIEIWHELCDWALHPWEISSLLWSKELSGVTLTSVRTRSPDWGQQTDLQLLIPAYNTSLLLSLCYVANNDTFGEWKGRRREAARGDMGEVSRQLGGELVASHPGKGIRSFAGTRRFSTTWEKPSPFAYFQLCSGK